MTDTDPKPQRRPEPLTRAQRFANFQFKLDAKRFTKKKARGGNPEPKTNTGGEARADDSV